MRTFSPTTVAAALLLATLPAFGAGQARGGFVFHSVSGVETHDRSSWDSVLNDSQGGAGCSAPETVSSPQQPESPQTPTPSPRKNGDPQTSSGAGGTTSPLGGAGGSGQVLGLVSRVSLSSPTVSGRLFLAEMIFDLPEPASRLFRPPRKHGVRSRS